MSKLTSQRAVDRAEVERLRAELRGAVVTPDAPEYDDARRISYSIVKSPCPMELFTWTIEWQEVQARPACASGVSICSLIGRSKRPLKNTA